MDNADTTLKQDMQQKPDMQQLQIYFSSGNPVLFFTPWQQGKEEMEAGCFRFKQQPGA